MTKKVFSKRKERRKKYEDKRWGKNLYGEEKGEGEGACTRKREKG